MGQHSHRSHASYPVMYHTQVSSLSLDSPFVTLMLYFKTMRWQILPCQIMTFDSQYGKAQCSIKKKIGMKVLPAQSEMTVLVL